MEGLLRLSHALGEAVASRASGQQAECKQGSVWSTPNALCNAPCGVVALRGPPKFPVKKLLGDLGVAFGVAPNEGAAVDAG